MKTRTNDKIVAKMVKMLTEHVSSIDTAAEVRNQTGYRFILDMTDALVSRGVPGKLACKGVARMKINLPTQLHIHYPQEYNKVISLYSLSMSVMYKAMVEDFHESVIEDVFIETCKQFEVELAF